jgi:hypothetical protein
VYRCFRKSDASIFKFKTRNFTFILLLGGTHESVVVCFREWHVHFLSHSKLIRHENPNMLYVAVIPMLLFLSGLFSPRQIAYPGGLHHPSFVLQSLRTWLRALYGCCLAYEAINPLKGIGHLHQDLKVL